MVLLLLHVMVMVVMRPDHEEDEDELLCTPEEAAGEFEWDAIDTTVGCPGAATPGGHPGGTPGPPAPPPVTGTVVDAEEEEMVEVEEEDMMLPPIASVVLGYVRLEETTDMATDGTPRAPEWGPAPPPNAGSTGDGPPAIVALAAGPPPPLYAGGTTPPPLPLPGGGGGGPPPRCMPGWGGGCAGCDPTTSRCEGWEECEGSDVSVVPGCNGPPAPVDGAVLETIVTEDVLLPAADDAEEEDDDEDELLLELELVFGVIGRTFCWAAAAAAAAATAAAACCCWAATISGDGSRSEGRPVPVGPLLVGPAPNGGCNRASISPRPMSVCGGMGVRAGCNRGDRFGEVTDGGR
uniref:Uncharacterized protein n=1 Tax=Anopheles culicifacies TaxID=139723 RepID=A0A182MLL6_9DIPT